MIEVQLTDDHVGKYMNVWTGTMSVSVKIISVGSGLIGWAVVDSQIPLRSGKCRYDAQMLYRIYDTADEAMQNKG